MKSSTSRTLLVVAAIVIGLAGVVVAMFEFGVLGRSAPEGAAPGRAAAREAAPSPNERAPSPTERTPSPTERTPAAQPALPQAAPANTPPEVRPSARTEAKLVATQIKAQKYVEEAYPAWRLAHPGEECPHQLIELNEYMQDKDANDAWGRPMRMQCSAARASGGKGIKVTSLGRDGERSEDDIKFGE